MATASTCLIGLCHVEVYDASTTGSVPGTDDIDLRLGSVGTRTAPRELWADGDLAVVQVDGTTVVIPTASLAVPMQVGGSILEILASGTTATSVVVGW